MNALVRPLPERELLIEDVEFKVGDHVGYASIVARARFYSDGIPYLFEAIDKDTGQSLALPSSFVAAIEEELEERYAPREVEEY